MPGRDFDYRRNLHPACDAQRFQAIARPTVNQVVAARSQVARCDPVEIPFLCAIVIRPFERREQAHRMPAQGLYERARNFPLPIIIGDRLAKETAVIRRAQGFEGIGIEAPASDPGKNRVEQAFREPGPFRRDKWRSSVL